MVTLSAVRAYLLGWFVTEQGKPPAPVLMHELSQQTLDTLLNMKANDEVM